MKLVSGQGPLFKPRTEIQEMRR